MGTSLGLQCKEEDRYGRTDKEEIHFQRGRWFIFKVRRHNKNEDLVEVVSHRYYSFHHLVNRGKPQKYGPDNENIKENSVTERC